VQMSKTHPYRLRRFAVLAMPLPLLLAVMACLPGCGGDGGGAGEGATITGTVVDAADVTIPVANAYVYIPGSGAASASRPVALRQANVAETHSEANGAYALSGVPTGRQRMVIEPPSGATQVSVAIDLDVPVRGSINVRITLTPGTLAPHIAGIAVDPRDKALAPGATQQYVATVTDDQAQPLDLTPIWLTTGGAGSIDENGLFTAGQEAKSGTVIAVLAGHAGATGVTVGAAPSNEPPTITSLAAVPGTTVAPGATVTLTATATDADSDSLGYAWFASGGGLSGTGPTVTWTAPSAEGKYVVGCAVDDGKGGSDSESISLTVESGPAPGPADSAWPMFQHDSRHTGQSPYVGPQTNHVKWTFDLVGSCGGIAIGSGGTVYAHGFPKLFAVNPDGTQQWAIEEIVKTTPAIAADGTLYCDCGIDRFRALYPDGSGKWLLTPDPGIGPGGTAPTIGPDGTVYVGSSGLFAINPDGTGKWCVNITGDPFEGPYLASSPGVAPDGTVYAGCTDSNVYAVRPDGTVKWTFRTSGPVQFGTGATIAPDGTLYIGSDDAMYAINPDGTEKWSFSGAVYGGARSCSAIAPDGTVYFGGYNGTLYAFNPNGVLKWDFDLDGPLESGPASSPVLGADGTVYVGAYHNIVALTPGGAEKWRYDFGTWVTGSAAIAEDGTLYVPCADCKLYAFGP